MKYAKDMTELIGGTPLVRINKLNPNPSNEIFAKLEFFNPSHSVKDRTALGILRNAVREGRIGKGSLIVEATSGNTGISLALLCAVYQMRLIVTMPENMSVERRKILKFFGAEIVLTEAGKGMLEAVKKAGEIAASEPGSFIPSQFENPANPMAHYQTTGPEIWKDLDGKADILVCGVGTGGTLTGTARFLKEKNNEVQIVAVEPFSSPVLSGGARGSHKIQGIGAGFIPAVLEKNLIDEIVQIEDESAKTMAAELAMKEGIFAGLSSGAAMKAAEDVSARTSGKKIVAVFPDTAERYMSSYVFGDAE